MGSRSKLSAALLLVAGALGLSGTAQAGTIYCPGTPLNIFDREFALTTTSNASCVDAGLGNFENAVDGEAVYLGAGWTTVDKTDGVGGTMNGSLSVSNLNGSSGSFSIASAVWDVYDSLLFVMKSGQGQYDPDWAVFSLASNTTSGTWNIYTLFGNANGLSHVNIYGQGGSTTAVAEPATLALFTAGLLGLFVVRRRRRKI